jgi:uracil phosphoribosyltransferase
MAASNVYISNHPLVRHKLTLLRDERTEHKKFRELIRELAMLLGYEATADLGLFERPVKTPLDMAPGYKLQEEVGLVPILRAGLGMVEGIHEMIPGAQVWHLGIYRDERTLRPVSYYNKLPVEPTVQVCLILDPMLATGGSALAAVEVLKQWGVKRIKFVGLIAAPEGIEVVTKAHPDVPIHLAAIDDHLNEHGFIVPGLGDAGDRQFGTA